MMSIISSSSYGRSALKTVPSCSAHLIVFRSASVLLVLRGIRISASRPMPESEKNLRRGMLAEFAVVPFPL